MKSEWLIFGFSTAKKKNVLSTMIMRLQGVNKSHSYIRHMTQWDEEMVYEAHGLSAILRNKRFFDPANIVIEEYKVMVTPELKYKVMKKIMQRLGTPYSVWQLFAIAAKQLAKKYLKMNIKNIYPNGERGTICVESCAEILQEIGYDLGEVDLDLADLVWLSDKIKEIDEFVRIK
jgi:hypothetical protein